MNIFSEMKSVKSVKIGDFRRGGLRQKKNHVYYSQVKSTRKI